MFLQSTMANQLMKSFSLMPPANSAFAKSHLLLITYRQLLDLNLLPLFLVQSQLGCRSSLGAGVCESSPVLIFMIHREIKVLTDLLQWLARTSPGEAAGQQVDLHDITSVILIGRENAQQEWVPVGVQGRNVNQRHNYFSNSSGKRICLLKAILTFISLQFLPLLCPKTRVTSEFAGYHNTRSVFWRQAQFSERSLMAQQKQRGKRSPYQVLVTKTKKI